MALALLPPPSRFTSEMWDALMDDSPPPSLPSSPKDEPMASAPHLPASKGTSSKRKPTGGGKPTVTSGGVELLVFNVLNTFRRRWFLSRAYLVTQVISAQKAEDGKLSWVEFPPPYHSHLVKCAVVLVPHRGCPLSMVKKVMFVYILELFNGEGHTAFFDLQKGGRKANNAQKEKRRLARKRSRAVKRERVREAAKAAKLPSCEQQCDGCGRKFNSRKTAKKHKCTASKVASVEEKVVVGLESNPKPPIRVYTRSKPAPPRHTPTVLAEPEPRPVRPMSSNTTVTPSVTGVLGGRSFQFSFVGTPGTNTHHYEMWDAYRAVHGYRPSAQERIEMNRLGTAYFGVENPRKRRRH
ncbi:hypothetical protein EI94DRAFT_1920486 [Lactarius quietus]|nr:hypothetical protein EI94DRAFT_1920486 [Lactarius quietus]